MANITNIDTLRGEILDLSLDIDIRIDSLERYCEEVGEKAIDIISLITGMFQFSGTKVLENYLYKICTHSNLSSFLKLEAAYSLLSFEEDEEEEEEEEKNEGDNDDECAFNTTTDHTMANEYIRTRNKARKILGYKALDTVCYDMTGVPTPCRVSAIIKLMSSPSHIAVSNIYFAEFIMDHTIDVDFRYKTILSLEKDPEKIECVMKASYAFLMDCKNETRYRILAAQKCLTDTSPIGCNVNECVLSFANDTKLEYNRRADAADMLLKSKDPVYVEHGRSVITLLGKETISTTKHTLFDNAQNVHCVEVEDSIIDTLEYLSQLPLLQVDSQPITFEHVAGLIKKGVSNRDNDCKTKVANALNRISMDRALYSRFNSSLRCIILKIWTYIMGHDDKNEMLRRLQDELCEMSDTCSTGFMARLVNSISGFGEFNIRISWESQIVANFAGRLNALAKRIREPNSPFYNSEAVKKLHNESCGKKCKHGQKKIINDFYNEVLGEMTTETSDFANRRHFLLFFRVSMSSIREEMYDEFKTLISDSDFDLYFRKAIMSYEGC